jgi:hypothetical protein
LSNIDDIRKVLQDFLAPELSATRESLEAIHKISDARYQSAQSQYAALQTHMELIKQQMQNNHDAVMAKLTMLEKEKV